MTIKHLVIVGGGPNVFIHYGILRHLSTNNFIKKENIKTIHATSAGSIAGLLVILNYNWDDSDEYLINRPWNKIFTVKPFAIINSLKTLGIYDEALFKEILKPYLEMNNLSVDITLDEFYKENGIEFNFYVTEYLDVKSCRINYKTHPDLKLITAVHMTCAIPIIFKPVKYNNNLYFDGALFKNYPLKDCIESSNITDYDEIMGIRQYSKYYEDDNEESSDNKSVNIEDLDFIKFFKNIMSNIMFKFNVESFKNYNIKNEIVIKTHLPDFTFWKDVVNIGEKRQELIQEGVQYAVDFLVKVNSKNDTQNELQNDTQNDTQHELQNELQNDIENTK